MCNTNTKKEWFAVYETLYLLSIPGMYDSIKKGLSTNIDECDEDLDW